MAVVVLRAEGDVLLRHVVECNRRIPRLEWIARISGEIRRAGCGSHRSRSIDGGHQHQIAPGIVDFSASQSQPEQIVVEPHSVVEHEPYETLLGTAPMVSGATNTTTELATEITG